MTIPTFYFDGNSWFGIVDSAERWFDLLASYDDLDALLDAKMASAMEVNALPSDYFLDAREGWRHARAVHAGKIPSFGFRREHLMGNVRLEDWAKNRGCDLRALASKRNKA